MVTPQTYSHFYLPKATATKSLFRIEIMHSSQQGRPGI